MGVAIRLTDESTQKLDKINEFLSKDSFIAYKLSYKKLIEALINEAYNQIVGDKNGTKSKSTKN